MLTTALAVAIGIVFAPVLLGILGAILYPFLVVFIGIYCMFVGGLKK